MSIENIIYIILAGIIALLVALFQYSFFSRQRNKQWILYAFLRFLSLFLLFLLLINPKFEQITYRNEKPNLAILVDNTESVKYLEHDKEALGLLERILNNPELNERFNLNTYVFGNTLKVSDSVNFSEKQTNLSSVFKELSEIHKNTTTPTILLTDGNQTYGNDYEFDASSYDQQLYPIILGDTTIYSDLRIQQLNVNRYAYLKNRFPVEVILTYNGNDPVSSSFIVTSGNSTVYRKNVSFSKDKNSHVLTFDLPASRVGIMRYMAKIAPQEIEKNKVNNNKVFAVEVIDQKTNVAIISDMVHPDIGALRKSIEANEQRSVTLLEPTVDVNALDDYQLLILYQPNRKFKSVYESIKSSKRNHITITGTKTDWNFISSTLDYLDKDLTNQSEDYQPILNSGYNAFLIDDLNFSSFPPLRSTFGDIDFVKPLETLLYKRIGSIDTEQPLLATIQTGEQREAFLFGEGIWRWRAQSYLNARTFNDFDNFIGKLVQYLASNKRRNRLSVNYESFYDGSSPVNISAQYFDQNYQFDDRGSLNIIVRNKSTGETSTFPFILNNTSYEVDLSNLPASDYAFTVTVNNEVLKQSGSFTILDYNVEEQFLNADATKLQRLATNSNGQYYFINDTDSLIPNLMNDNRYATVQKSSKKVVPLIDWKYLLALIALSLAIEWFMRKYNGLI